MSQVNFNKNIKQGSTEYLAKNLIGLLERHQINSSELAKSLNIPYNTIHRIINGATSDPRISTLQQIADYFDVSLDFLINGSVHTNAGEQSQSILIPVLSWDYIQKPNFLDELDRKAWTKWLPIAPFDQEHSNNNNLFALESTRSMQPRFPVGTVFIVKINEQPLDGDLALIRFKKDNSISLREIIIDSPHWHLNAIITGSSSLIFDSDSHEISGVIILTLIQTRIEF